MMFMIVALPGHASAQRGYVVIIAEEDKMVYEFRQNGELRMIRIVPTFGKPYYLVHRFHEGFRGPTAVDA